VRTYWSEIRLPPQKDLPSINKAAIHGKLPLEAKSFPIILSSPGIKALVLKVGGMTVGTPGRGSPGDASFPSRVD